MTNFRWPLLAVLALLFPSAALAQRAPGAPKISPRYYEDAQAGYRLKVFANWNSVPLQPRERDQGLVLRMDGKPITSVQDGEKIVYTPSVFVFRFVEEKTEKKSGKGKTSAVKVKRAELAKVLERAVSFEIEGAPDLDENVEFKNTKPQHRRWSGSYRKNPIDVDTYTFRGSNADFCVVYVTAKGLDKWWRAFEDSAETFEEIAIDESTLKKEGGSYEDLLSFYSAEAAAEGWKAMPTPSKKFIIKTSADNKKFLKAVIQRLEASRKLFEEDFPPPEDFDAVSVVRVCGSEEEFHKYGGTGSGVAGWFNPGTKELVLYDAVQVDRNKTYAVMSHEAFHQYCHYLFGEAEAHRWYDEGHGDYYGGAEFKGRRAKITPRMPGGLNRLDIIRDMVRRGAYVPLIKHLNFTHPQWQSHGVESYSQSWSIIYMLREGMKGRVNRKVWKKEYADIIPNYVETLNAAYREAKGEGKKHVPKKEIWKQAMDASWGKIDLQQFEADWTTYVADHLK